MTGSASGRRETTARPIPAGGRAAERRTALVMAVAVTTIAGYAVLAAAAASRLVMLGALGPGDWRPLAVVLCCLAAVSYPAVGSVVVVSRPGHPAGWLLMGIGAGWLLSTVGDLLVSAGYAGESWAPVISRVALVGIDGDGFR